MAAMWQLQRGSDSALLQLVVPDVSKLWASTHLFRVQHLYSHELALIIVYTLG